MIEARQFSSADELMAHYREVLARRPKGLVQSPRMAPPPRIVEVVPETLSQSRDRLADLVSEANRAVRVRSDLEFPACARHFQAILVHTDETSVMSLSPRYTVNDILRIVAATFAMPIKDISGPYRAADIVYARHCACWLCRRFTPRSFPDIGRRIGGRDHTTVMHADRKITALVNSESLSAPLDTPEAWAIILRDRSDRAWSAT